MSSKFTAHSPKVVQRQPGLALTGRPLTAPVSREKLEAAWSETKLRAGAAEASPPAGQARAKEFGGPSGPEPTRFGDWERNGICVDF